VLEVLGVRQRSRGCQRSQQCQEVVICTPFESDHQLRGGILTLNICNF
jgi:hypothetical protein